MNYSLNLDLFSYILTSEKEVVIKQLSGYPYIDIDLIQIFNLLPINYIIEIYILSIIEQSMLFFSSNLEILNMVMFIMFVLNYPCNDSPYFWHIVSISKDNFDEDNKFVGKVMTSMLGVNVSYAEDMNTEPFGKFNYIIDIDKKNIILKKEISFIEEEDGKEFEELNNFRVYISNILKDKKVDSLFLKQFIDNMKKNLTNILSKEDAVKDKTVNFFVSSDDIIEKNFKIQEIFYDFHINILTIFSQDNTLNNTYEKIEKEKPNEIYKKILKLRNFEDRKEGMNSDEAYFCYMFRKSFKYKVYFENFVKSFESLDIFKIPLLFSQEFINIKIKDIKNEFVNKISLFKTIDALYIPDSSEAITIKITLNNIFYDYMERLKKYFSFFFTKERLDKMKKSQLITLDKKILTKYIYSIKIQETSSIVSINSKSIINTIKLVAEDKYIIDNKDYLIFSVIYILSITFPIHSYDRTLELLEMLSKSLSKLTYFMPYFVYILMKTILKFYIIHKEKHLYSDFTITNIKMYIFILLNLLRKNLFLPNEKSMEILKLFFGKLFIQSSGSNPEQPQETEDKYFVIERDKNFLCFMKYCFTGKKMFSSRTLVNYALKDKRNCNINITAGKNKIMQPKIINENLDFEKLRIKTVRDVIVNLIQFSVELNQTENVLPLNFLIYSLYFLKDL